MSTDPTPTTPSPANISDQIISSPPSAAQTAAPAIGPALSRRAAIGALGVAGLAAVTSAAPAGPGRPPRPRQPGRPLRNRDGGAGFSLLTEEELGYDRQSRRYTLPKLPYEPDALEPAIDAQTMQIHHSKHHQGYVDGLNKALDKLDEIRSGSGDAGLIKHWSRELSFHGSGHVNHSLFWQIMAPNENGSSQAQGPVADQINRDFGGFDAFKAHFTAAAGAVEGSGWGWLAWEPTARRLMIMQGEKQQNMLMTGVVPILGVDVWEHAYYLKYQNKRAEYVNAFFNVINWPKVNELFERLTA